MLKAVITEKSSKLAKDGKYTFDVNSFFTKFQVKELVEKTFGVKVKKVYSMNKRSVIKRNARGKKRVISAGKKIVVSLRGKDKIDLFEEKKK